MVLSTPDKEEDEEREADETGKKGWCVVGVVGWWWSHPMRERKLIKAEAS